MSELTKEQVKFYEDNGYLELPDDGNVVKLFNRVVKEALKLDDKQFEAFLWDTKAKDELPPDVRKGLAKCKTTEKLELDLQWALFFPIYQLLGPIIHISNTFHVQIKQQRTNVIPVDHGGYTKDSDYKEVHSPYLLHQDFSGATIPTSPSMMTLWVPLNDSPDWNLRIYPGSHKHGLLCNKWLQLNDPRLKPLGPYVDIRAEVGKIVLFNGLTLHGTSNYGPWRRVSCDIRFFPLCGFLPLTPYQLTQPTNLQYFMLNGDAPCLKAPIMEDILWLGGRLFDQSVAKFDIEDHSVYNWVAFIASLLKTDIKAAEGYLRKFTNEGFGVDTADTFIKKFIGHQINKTTLEKALAKWTAHSAY